MKILLLITIITGMLYATPKEQLYRLYQNGDYLEACTQGMRDFHANRKDHEFVSLYAFSCLNADYIDRLAAPISVLRSTPESRANAAYLSVILMQKKLLYHALLDGYDLSSFSVPTTDYILSKVFALYTQEPRNHRKKFHTFKDASDPRRHYKLYIDNGGSVKKMVIEEYYDTIMAHRHIYW